MDKSMKTLKEARQKAGLTQAQVADAIGTSQQNYQRWEKGNAAPDIDTIRSLSAILKVPLNTLMARRDPLFARFADNHHLVNADPSGYWGHIGIQLERHTEIRWHPISATEYSRIFQAAQISDPNEAVVFDTLDNRAITVLPARLNRLILLDEAGDDLYDAAERLLDPIEQEGGLPSVIYAGLTALALGDDDELDKLGQAVRTRLEELTEQLGGMGAIYPATMLTTIHMTDGTAHTLLVEDEQFYQLMDEMTYEIGTPIIIIDEEKAGTQFIPVSKIAMVDAPKTLVAAAMAKQFEELP